MPFNVIWLSLGHMLELVQIEYPLLLNFLVLLVISDPSSSVEVPICFESLRSIRK